MKSVFLFFAAFVFFGNLAQAGFTCPDGTKKTGGTPPDQFEAACVSTNKSGDSVREGPFESYYVNGQKHSAGQYHEGKRTGRWTWWYPNGRKMQEGSFSEDQAIMAWHFWDEDGIRIKEEAVSKNRADFDSFARSVKDKFNNQ